MDSIDRFYKATQPPTSEEEPRKKEILSPAEINKQLIYAGVPDNVDFESIIADAFLPYDKPVEKETFIGEIHGVKALTLGNISTVQGSQKTGKSFLLSAVAASALSGQMVLNFFIRLPEGKNRVLYIDTEQGEESSQRIQTCIRAMAGEDCKPEERLAYFRLRQSWKVFRAATVRRIIERIPNVGLVIIDGIRDLVHNFNDVEQASSMTDELMRWSGEYQIHIMNVIHTNKSDKNARGHLGSELLQKSEIVLEVAKKEENSDVRTVDVLYTRNAPIEPFRWNLDTDADPIRPVLRDILNDETDEIDKKVLRSTDPQYWAIIEGGIEKHREILSRMFPAASTSYTYSDLLTELRARYSAVLGRDFGKSAIKDGLLKYLKANNYIIQEEDRKGSPYRANLGAFDGFDGELPFNRYRVNGNPSSR